jgi:acetyl-CoA C-acetyltransferase/acetyl-CoA acyltransferase
VITAANSSQISDGASAGAGGQRRRAKADGLRAKARFRARVVSAQTCHAASPGSSGGADGAAQSGPQHEDIDWIEINEAFASVVLSWARELNADLSKVNPWGGAIAHGHPLGATGGALMAKMLPA